MWPRWPIGSPDGSQPRDFGINGHVIPTTTAEKFPWQLCVQCFPHWWSFSDYYCEFLSFASVMFDTNNQEAFSGDSKDHVVFSVFLQTHPRC